MRKDPVTAEVRRAVFARDVTAIWDHLAGIGLSIDQIKAVIRSKPACVVTLLDPSESAHCSGRPTLDHVKDEPMMGKRAPSDEKHLVTICSYHHLDTHAGYNWATGHRPLLRRYLRDHYEDAA